MLTRKSIGPVLGTGQLINKCFQIFLFILFYLIEHIDCSLPTLLGVASEWSEPPQNIEAEASLLSVQ